MAKEELNYTSIDAPYNNQLQKVNPVGKFEAEATVGIGSPNQIKENIVNGEAMDDMRITNWIKSNNYKPGVAGFKIDGMSGDVEFGNGKFRGDITGATGTFSGSVIVGNIHIPDKDTTADSFHVQADANTWWGCTETDFNTDNNNAKAYILKTGVAKFQEIVLGTNVVLSGLQTGSSLAIQYIDAGTITSKIFNLDFIDGTGDVAIRCGKSDFGDDTNGFILGVDDSDSNKIKFEIGNATNYLKWTGSALNIKGEITATTGEIGGWTIGATALTAASIILDSGNEKITIGTSNPMILDGASGSIKTAETVGAGSNGVIMDTDGLRGYDSVLGNVFNLPTDGSAPTFSSGIINETIFNINTNAVLRTSETVGDGSVNSAGVLINNTGVYICESNQAVASANFKALVDGTVSVKGAITIENPGDIDGSTINNDGGWTDDTAADTAQIAADNAQDDVDDAQLKLDDIAADIKITPVEKLTAKPLWDAIVAEKTNIDTQADTYSVSKTAYGTAYDDLNTYLNTTITVFSSMTATTDITRTDWDGFWKAYYDAKIETLQAIADATALLANWDDITGVNKPTDGADVTQTIIDGGMITTGYITLGTAGNIKSGKANYVDDTAGWWLGNDAGDPKFNIGNSDNSLKWNGEHLTIRGAFDVSSDGTINNSSYDVANLPITKTEVGFNSPTRIK